jgi:hypothetical protein
MGCYCYDTIVKAQNFDARLISFSDVSLSDSTLYCDTWFNEYAIELAVKFGSPLLITVINAIVSFFFKISAPWELRYTKNDETTSTFSKLTVL